MKLTKFIRNAFVRAAMDDVPSVDYDEQITKVARAEAIAMMPPKVSAAYKAHPDWFTETGHYFDCRGWANLPIPEGKKFTAEATAKIDALRKKRKAQSDARDDLSAKLRGAAYSVTTRKALVALLPEFEKYLPADEQEANRSLPVIANLVTDFTKAGWPKGKKPVAASAK